MNEATVEFQVSVDMPERIVPVTMVEMGIASEHLLDDGLDVLLEVEGKSRGFANPLIWVARKCVHRLIEVCGWCRDRCSRGGRV